MATSDSCCAADCSAEQQPMTAEMVERLVAMHDAEPLPMRWALLQLVARLLQYAVEYDDPLPESLLAFANEQARRAVYNADAYAETEAAALLWHYALAEQREAAVEALWAELQGVVS
ncbi:MAG TPA: hypothetical protein VM537_32530 [Anaerolineae bacterium]|nr:hypothetical protein [Anaerolineae bacterium]